MVLSILLLFFSMTVHGAQNNQHNPIVITEQSDFNKEYNKGVQIGFVDGFKTAKKIVYQSVTAEEVYKKVDNLEKQLQEKNDQESVLSKKIEDLEKAFEGAKKEKIAIEKNLRAKISELNKAVSDKEGIIRQNKHDYDVLTTAVFTIGIFLYFQMRGLVCNALKEGLKNQESSIEARKIMFDKFEYNVQLIFSLFGSLGCFFVGVIGPRLSLH